MIAPADHVIIKCEEVYDDHVKVGDAKIYRDTTWEPHQYKKNSVEVVAIPKQLTADYLVFQDVSGEYYFHDSFPIEVRVGDFAVCDWSVLDESYSIGDSLYKIPYSAIYAVERKKPNNFTRSRFFNHHSNIGLPESGVQFDFKEKDLHTEIIPLMSWVFLEPYYGEGIEEENGIKVRKKDGIVIETNPKELQYTARVKYIGTNVYGLKPNYKVGDLAFVNLEWASVVTIQGQELYAVRQNQLMGRCVIN